jgi:hypothetical protein
MTFFLHALDDALLFSRRITAGLDKTYPADCSGIRKDRPLSDRIALVFRTTEKPDRGCTRVLRQRLYLEPVGAILNFGKAHSDWHSTCRVECAVSLGKK